MEIAGYQYTAHLNIKCFMMETFPTLERTCREGNLKKKEVISESIQNMNAFRRASKQLNQVGITKKISVGSCDNLKKYVYQIM